MQKVLLRKEDLQQNILPCLGMAGDDCRRDLSPVCRTFEREEKINQSPCHPAHKRIRFDHFAIKIIPGIDRRPKKAQGSRVAVEPHLEGIAVDIKLPVLKCLSRQRDVGIVGIEKVDLQHLPAVVLRAAEAAPVVFAAHVDVCDVTHPRPGLHHHHQTVVNTGDVGGMGRRELISR